MHQSVVALLGGRREMAVPGFIGQVEERSGEISLSRWTTTQPSMRRILETAGDEHVVTVCLRSTRIELHWGATSHFDGVMGLGAAHITGPSHQVEVAVRGPCNLLHLHVPGELMQARLRNISPGKTPRDLDGCTVQDPLIGQLGELMSSAEVLDDDVYGQAVVYTLLTRILRQALGCPRVGTLPKWRLRRVQSLIDQNLSYPLTLREMAAAAGLSRIHFATQFRATAGCTPHHYLLCQRIQAAKGLLAESDLTLVEIALSVGFTDQAHFTKVFKRLTGETPGRWRRAHHDIPVDFTRYSLPL